MIVATAQASRISPPLLPDPDKIFWTPHPGPQTRALQVVVDELLYGGARGPGKTDAGIWWISKPVDMPRYRGLVIRRNSTDLEDWTDRADIYYSHLGARKVGSPARFIFPSGAIIRTGHLKDEHAYTKYVGHEYQRILIEELTQIPRELDYLMLLSSCRTTIPGLDARFFGTTNPGGTGHQWVKKRFVDPAPPGTRFTDPKTGRTRMFIPGRVEDNPTLVKNDPGYLLFLDALPEPLRSAWRDGDWDVFAGQYFVPYYESIHVIEPFGPFVDPEKWSEGWNVVVGLDWGYHHPFAAEFLAIDTDGNQYFYREIVHNQKTAEWWAEELQRAIDPREPVIAWPMGRDAWQKTVLSYKKAETAVQVEYSVAQAMIDGGIPLIPADNAPGSRVIGWQHMLSLLGWDGEVLPGGQVDFENGHAPKMYLIRGTCPMLQEQFVSAICDEHKVEDVEKHDGDDPLDASRYATSYAREAIAPPPAPPEHPDIAALEAEDELTEGGTYEW